MAFKADRTTDGGLFRDLTDEEEKQFREYARNNEPNFGAWSIMHPICRDEWIKLGKFPCVYCHKAGTTGLGMVNGVDMLFCDDDCHQAYLDDLQKGQVWHTEDWELENRKHEARMRGEYDE